MTQSTILIVEDDESLREALSDTLELAGYTVCAADSGANALECMRDTPVGMVISDVQMEGMDGHELLRRIHNAQPDLPFVLMTAFGTIQKAVEAMRNGAIDYLVKPFEAEVLVEMVSRYVSSASVDPSTLVAEDDRTRDLFALAARVADSEATVMITGESGTGKEVLARYVHQNSVRSEGPFVAINCAAIPENMLEAVLFGYEKGAFTGAYQSRPGKFEQAQEGTLLLDEISEMDLGLQAKLLRVLQEREVERLGGRQMIPLNVRVLATSNKIMREEVAAGRFREDLFYRLNVFPLHLPSLKARRSDILPLARRLIERHVQAGKPIPMLSAAAERHLFEHSWPGNVRELENVVQRAMILSGHEEIQPEHLQFECDAIDASDAAAAMPVAADDRLDSGLKSHENQLILDALAAGNGSRKLAAERLGISPRTLRYKLARMREAGIQVPA